MPHLAMELRKFMDHHFQAVARNFGHVLMLLQALKIILLVKRRQQFLILYVLMDARNQCHRLKTFLQIL